MNTLELYQWNAVIDKQFGKLGRWQKQMLASLSYGILKAENCRLGAVAKHLTGKANANSMERRLQRWLANERMVMKLIFKWWITWIVQLWGKAAFLILVDETKLSDHVAVMMVGLAYQGSAIPLIWRAYQVEAYPEEGQVALISELLQQLREVLPPDQAALLLADRGLGSSPTWQARLSEMNWRYLLRVQRSTRIRLAGQKPQPLSRLVGYGQTWTGRAQVFKKAGWQWKWVYLIWEVGYAEPCCLFSNQPDLSPDLYTRRFQHEASFRDLKSDGFQWQRSHVWLPAHVERLLLGLALATLWSLTEGTKAVFLAYLSARQKTFSVFRLGLDYLFQRFASPKELCLEFFLAPDTPCLKSVVW
jgi:hypothetical protein